MSELLTHDVSSSIIRAKILYLRVNRLASSLNAITMMTNKVCCFLEDSASFFLAIMISGGDEFRVMGEAQNSKNSR